MSTNVKDDDELFGYFHWLGEKYKRNPLGVTCLILIVLHMAWTWQIAVEQQRRAIHIKAIEQQIINGAVENGGLYRHVKYRKTGA